MQNLRYACATILISVGTLFAVMLVGMSIKQLIEHHRLDHAGVTTTGIVTSKHRSAGDRSPRFFIEYRFVSSAGSAHEGLSDVPVSLYERVTAGSPLAIQYLSTAPATSAARDNAIVTVALRQMFGAILLSLFVALGYREWRKLRLQRVPLRMPCLICARSPMHAAR